MCKFFSFTESSVNDSEGRKIPAIAELYNMVLKNFIFFNKMSRNYKFYNPVEAGLVFRPEVYIYSSAKMYSGEKVC